MMSRGLAHWGTEFFSNFWSVESIFAFGHKGSMRIWRPLKKGNLQELNVWWGEPGTRTFGMVSEQEASELADRSSLSECLLCLSYRTNYCERTQRKEKTKTLSSRSWQIGWTEHTGINARALLPSSNCVNVEDRSLVGHTALRREPLVSAVRLPTGEEFWVEPWRKWINIHKACVWTRLKAAGGPGCSVSFWRIPWSPCYPAAVFTKSLNNGPWAPCC